MERTLAPIEAHAPSARPEELAGFEVPPVRVEFSVHHGVNITSTSAESLDWLRLRAPEVYPACRARRDHQRRVVAFRAAAGIWLAEDPRTMFVPEPIAYGLCAEPPELRPVADRVMLFLKWPGRTKLACAVHSAIATPFPDHSAPPPKSSLEFCEATPGIRFASRINFKSRATVASSLKGAPRKLTMSSGNRWIHKHLEKDGRLGSAPAFDCRVLGSIGLNWN